MAKLATRHEGASRQHALSFITGRDWPHDYGLDNSPEPFVSVWMMTDLAPNVDGMQRKPQYGECEARTTRR